MSDFLMGRLCVVELDPIKKPGMPGFFINNEELLLTLVNRVFKRFASRKLNSFRSSDFEGLTSFWVTAHTCCALA
jgi:hypothetical protein